MHLSRQGRETDGQRCKAFNVCFGSQADLKRARLRRPLLSGKQTSNALSRDSASLRSANGRKTDIESKEYLPKNFENIWGLGSVAKDRKCGFWGRAGWDPFWVEIWGVPAGPYGRGHRYRPAGFFLCGRPESMLFAPAQKRPAVPHRH